MHIHLQFGGHTAHRLLHIILTIDPKMLAHGVQHLLIRRQLRLRATHHTADIIIINLASYRGNRMGPAVVKAFNVCPGHTEINTPDFNIRLLLRFI